MQHVFRFGRLGRSQEARWWNVKIPFHAMLHAMPVKMSDIAGDLDVSVVTVSKVLRNQGKISQHTRQRVLQRCRELNYRPNLIARSLATRRTYTIGLLLPDFTHPFFAQIAKSVAQTARARGYHALISYFEEDPQIEMSEAETLLARQVDGLILASAQSEANTPFFQHVLNHQTPLVLIDRPMQKVRASFVGVDHVGIGKMATEHLIVQGCRRIAHLRGPELAIANDRFHGYCLALQNRGLPVLRDHIVQGGFDSERGHEALLGLLNSGIKIDGAFCFNDLVAIGAIKAIQATGRSVPDDIKVVGAGNVNYADALAIPLTTIDQAPGEMGVTAATLLIDQIESNRVSRRKRIIVPHTLVVRRSTERRSMRHSRSHGSNRIHQ